MNENKRKAEEEIQAEIVHGANSKRRKAAVQTVETSTQFVEDDNVLDLVLTEEQSMEFPPTNSEDERTISESEDELEQIGVELQNNNGTLRIQGHWSPGATGSSGSNKERKTTCER